MNMNDTPNIEKLNNNDIRDLASIVAFKLIERGYRRLYPIPRGGVPAAYAVIAACPTIDRFEIVANPEDADCFIDDIIDSGKTMQNWCDKFPGKPFFALIDKTDEGDSFKDCWVVFPWEDTVENSIEDNIRRLLQFCGENPNREGLLETPKRVAKAWSYWCGGYHIDPASLLKTFEDGAENCDEMIIRRVPFYSHCEHHMAAIIGVAIVAYIPNKKIVGLSKIDRVVDAFARRLQVQERLTNQIAEAIQTHLEPKGVGVWINARHLCIESRGVRNQDSVTDSLALRGVFRTQQETRQEFLAVARSKVQ